LDDYECMCSVDSELVLNEYEFLTVRWYINFLSFFITC
jgi:hypothetical protein